MLDKYIRTVKGQLAYFDAQIRRWSRSPDHPAYDPRKLTKYNYLAEEFQDLLEYLLQQRRTERTAPSQVAQEASSYEVDEEVSSDEVAPETAEESNPEPIPPLSTPPRASALTSPGDDDNDLSDLPPELLKELSDSFKGETDPLITIINDRGGTASIDEILVDLYRRFNEIGKRPIISNKLYRFSRRGLCAPVPGKKGFYTTDPTMLRDGGEAEEEEEEGPDVSASEPSSNGSGVAGLPEGPSKPSPVGSTPSTSTKKRRELFASTAIPSFRDPH